MAHYRDIGRFSDNLIVVNKCRSTGVPFFIFDSAAYICLAAFRGTMRLEGLNVRMCGPTICMICKLPVHISVV